MESIGELVKRGNKSSASAALGNAALALVKGIAAFVSGSGTMFASAMHSLADSVNQGFVFVGSILAEKEPTPRFPAGFGRLINLFCVVAVMVVSMMAYETVREGIQLLMEPHEPTHFLLNAAILALSVLIDGMVLVKAMNEILKETGVQVKGWRKILAAFRSVGRAAPPTRLVFYEDIVATLGAFVALISVFVSHFTPFRQFDGIATVMIGLLMAAVALKVGYDNMIGLIGVAAPKEVEDKVAGILFSDPIVTDINFMRIVQEGRFYHVECDVELRPGLTLAEADDIKFRLRDRLLAEPQIADVVIGIIEDNGVQDWRPERTASAI
ncbi:cation diffusion facilitator family transporter [Staphylospora marina]|uniref:cation diffusion facilitator family transporter n=1 Tax=Staphylospora marina TaxID=2490858 RepID=UPI000F5C1F65|nr:cation diffusion facilitator family transporter [Staphylospora marina]